MTRTFRISLGNGPLTGRDSISLLSKFREQPLSLYPKPASVSLIAVFD